MQEVSSLKLVHHVLLRNLLGGDGGDGMMCGGIERLADRLDGRNMKSLQGSRQLFEGEIHALNEDIAAPPFP
jgi:hypothetical protein